MFANKMIYGLFVHLIAVDPPPRLAAGVITESFGFAFWHAGKRAAAMFTYIPHRLITAAKRFDRVRGQPHLVRDLRIGKPPRTQILYYLFLVIIHGIVSLLD
jgi:hypothetical protein